VLLNLADMRTVHSREALVSLRERFGEQVFDSVIRSSIAYAESAERARSILDHRPTLARTTSRSPMKCSRACPASGRQGRLTSLAHSSET